MREIKFRAWDRQEKIMIAIGFHVFGEVHAFAAIECHCHETRRDKDTLERLNDIEVMQFTGLKDKNGKEIYEGDIIRAYQSDGSQVLHSISYSNEEARFIVSCIGYGNLSGGFDKRWIEEFGKEIIGNIYENPELLTP